MKMHSAVLTFKSIYSVLLAVGRQGAKCLLDTDFSHAQINKW